MPQQNANAQQQPQEQHVIASPNPTIDDSKTPATIGPKKVETVKVQPAKTTTQAPMKTTHTKSKSHRKHGRTKPRG